METKNINKTVYLKNVDDIIQKAEEIARNLKGSGTKTQIRKILSILRKYERDYIKKGKIQSLKEELKFLKPKINYQCARNKDISYIKDYMIHAIEQVVREEKDVKLLFERLIRFVESIIAYME